MKTNVKKFFKILMPVVGVGVVSCGIVFVSGCLVQTPLVSLGGSTAVLPLINALSPYIDFIDVVTSAGGSGVGISSIIDGTKEIGIASTTPDILTLGSDNTKYQIWDEKKVKTVTIAWDGIALVYKPSSNSANANVIINEENLAKIYHAFSGDKQFKLGDLLNNNDETIIVPYARNGGSSVSGTTEAFFKDSHLNYKDSPYWKSLEAQNQVDNITNAITNGGYGPNVIQTAESNSQAWNVAKNGPEGSFVYLSAGFVINNIEEIQKYGFKVALYGEQGISPLEPGAIASTYNWYRPLNLMYSMTYVKNIPEIPKMIAWILFDEQAKKIINDEGYVPLSEASLQSMGWNGNLNDMSFLTNDSPEGTYDVKLGYSGAK